MTCENLQDMPNYRLAILVTHDQTSARETNQWVSQQADYRQAQIMLILPQGESRLEPVCAHTHRPFHLNILQRFMAASRALPNLPSSIKLTEIETKLMEQLHVAGEAVTHDSLMQNVWGYSNDLDTHTLETHLYRLRKKLGKTGFSIITEEGSYQLVLSSSK